MPLAIGGHKWLRLLVVATAVYLTLLPVWWYALDGLATFAAALAGWIYRIFDPQVSILSDGKLVRVTVPAPAESGFSGPPHSSALRMDTITYGLPMLLALISATRANCLRAKLRSLAIGSFVMLLITVPAVMFWAKLTSLQMEEAIAAATMSGRGNRSSFFYYAFHGYAFSQPALAVAVWIGLLLLGSFKGKPKAAAATPATARNALCPCGSGKKYKRCCGRV